MSEPIGLLKVDLSPKISSKKMRVICPPPGKQVRHCKRSAQEAMYPPGRGRRRSGFVAPDVFVYTQRSGFGARTRAQQDAAGVGAKFSPNARPAPAGLTTSSPSSSHREPAPMNDSAKPDAISVIVIVKNEAHDIRDCLASVHGWVDEIVVLDSGSTDGTQAICREFGATVVETDWPGFGPQKQRALDAARGPWILSLDADERVSPLLRDEILASVKTNGADLFRVPRQSNYCGKWIRHSGWSPDYVTRLFRRDAARFSNDLVHERVIAAPEARVGTLAQALIHYSFRDFSEVLGKIDSYSTYGATQGAARGKRGGLRKAVLHGFWSFVRSWIIQRGFLDGKMGFVLAISNAEGTYYRYLKLMLLETQQSAAAKARDAAPESR
ncbi:glycosyltransferase family 2 protein [Paraburkholderia sp. CNPSo 3274]|uniref:glycosyltransferase family 2 protein n=1 Tax=Paraburkholderia sp. CNPSo 3274 TaxID=2940932 RepID=UPI00281606FE|nr:glycosyltransferase family 2 protein [Paraburkholderia sp. CNPSo 3274]